MEKGKDLLGPLDREWVVANKAGDLFMDYSNGLHRRSEIERPLYVRIHQRWQELPSDRQNRPGTKG